MVYVNADHEFARAVSLFAALEGACGTADGVLNGILPYLGMARAELTDYGNNATCELIHVPVTSLPDSLGQLCVSLEHLLKHSVDLAQTLRVREALLIMREGCDRVGLSSTRLELH